MTLRTLIVRTLVGIAVTSVLWFLVQHPEQAATFVRNIIGGVAGAIDSGARFLEGLGDG